jgi:hypothetical protein
MAISTYLTYLMYKESDSASSYSQLADVNTYPNLGGDPEQLDATTLTQAMKTFIEGIKDNEAMTFEANYDVTVYKKLEGLTGKTLPLAVYFGKSGENGKFTWDGTINVRANGGGVNEVRKMTITSTPETEIKFSTGTAE